MTYSNAKSGFTILETLVAVTILMLAIVGPLTVSQKSLVASTYAKDQIIAAYLAQDAMEFLKNARDTQVSAGLFSNWVSTYSSLCTIANPCSIDTYLATIQQCGNACLVYDRGDRYTNLSSTPGRTTRPTIYSRNFYLDISPSATTNSSNEVRVVVRVFWRNALAPSEVLLESQFFNISR